jgi:acetyltransferase-like isoleucine patch superfamily enzyme
VGAGAAAPGADRRARRRSCSGRPRVDATDLVIGERFRIWSAHRQTVISGGGRLRIGDRVFVNSGSVIIAVQEIVIGDDVAFANEAYVMDSNSHGVEGRSHVEAPVHIGDGTWIGARAMVLPGVTIGKRVLVAAGSGRHARRPDDVLVAGNPAASCGRWTTRPAASELARRLGLPCPQLVDTA